jgi:pimeloyl-ACP methyl ester carboxylesterase
MLVKSVAQDLSPQLQKQFRRTSFGDIAYLEVGSEGQPPVLFIHGIPTSGYLWRHVLRFLQDNFHCYAPDLMGLGDTEVDPQTTAFHMEAQAQMLEELMDSLGHQTFAVVAHDQGGAAAQILAARRPERLTALVLTDVVCYDNWPVPVIAQLQTLFRWPLLPELLLGARLIPLLELKTPFSAFRRGVYQRAAFAEEAMREYLRPLLKGKIGREGISQMNVKNGLSASIP